MRTLAISPFAPAFPPTGPGETGAGAAPALVSRSRGRASLCDLPVLKRQTSMAGSCGQRPPGEPIRQPTGRSGTAGFTAGVAIGLALYGLLIAGVALVSLVVA